MVLGVEATDVLVTLTAAVAGDAIKADVLGNAASATSRKRRSDRTIMVTIEWNEKGAVAGNRLQVGPC